MLPNGQIGIGRREIREGISSIFRKTMAQKGRLSHMSHKEEHSFITHEINFVNFRQIIGRTGKNFRVWPRHTNYRILRGPKWRPWQTAYEAR